MAIQPKEPLRPADGDGLAPPPLRPSDEEPVTISLDDDDEEEPIKLDEDPIPMDEGDESEGGPSRIQAFGTASRTEEKKEFTRPLNLTGTGATRCRLFNSKITVAAIDHMISVINEWLDGEQIEVKHVSEVIGTMEGKKPEPNIIVTIWY